MKQSARRIVLEPGYEGAVEINTDVRVTATRSETRVLRCRPGTFEWRYARSSKEKGLSALYHAGVHYAGLWEKAGTAAASSPDLLAEGGSGWKGLPDSRCAALDDLREAFKALGLVPTSRLTSYCVSGDTVSDIAARFGVPSRDMAAVLNLDLHACAMHFNYL